ncbi:MAG: hypothetical protein RL141_425 [Candidatus Parcubacteria bacterium]
MILIGLALIVVVGAFTWFWLLASVPRTEAVELTLVVERSPVMVKAAGGETFTDAENGMRLSPGDTVKTGEGGQAVIQFFGLAESRLDEQSELIVRDASHDDAIPDSLSVRLHLSGGRVWSRVLRLFDIESGFAVETPTIVATVRGTAFDVAFDATGETRLWVSDSAVTVLPASVQDQGAMLRQLRTVRERRGNSTSTAEVVELALGAMPAGEMATYNAQGTPTVHRRLSAEDRNVPWFVQNTQADGAFITRAADERRAALARLGGARPDQVRYGLTRLSERAHLLVAGAERTEVTQEQYLVRRLARLLDLVDAGKTGLASQEFARLENDIRTQLADGADGDARRRIKAAVVRVMRMVEDADPASAPYPFKQRLEDLLLALSEGDDAVMLFTRLVAVDARMDEASRLLDRGDLDGARTALNAARGGLENVSRDAEPVLPTLVAARQQALIGKILALIARESAERVRLDLAVQAAAAINTPAVTPESIPVVATSTPPVSAPPVAPTTPPVPVPPVVTTPTPLFTSIRLALGAAPLMVGVETDLIVSAVRNDGSTQDVSARSTFRLVRGSGILNGLRFTATAAETIVLEASYSDEGLIQTAQISVPAVGIAVLQSVATTPAVSTIRNGASIPLTVIATYTDGSTKDVTTSATWSFTPTAYGRMAGNVFTGVNPPTVAVVPRTVTVQATYTEAGKTSTGNATVTVQ